MRLSAYPVFLFVPQSIPDTRLGQQPLRLRRIVLQILPQLRHVDASAEVVGRKSEEEIRARPAPLATSDPATARMTGRQEGSLLATRFVHQAVLEMSRPTLIVLSLLLTLATARDHARAQDPAPSPATSADSSDVPPEAEVGPPVSATNPHENVGRFASSEGKRIARIRVKVLPVFGPSIDDTTRTGTSRLSRLLNTLHSQTRDVTVRNNLLFGEGDILSPFRLADSERMLRGLPFFDDARIVVEPHPAGADSVEVLVLVKDRWGLEVSGSLKEGNRIDVDVSEQNLLGLGHRASVGVTFIPQAAPGSGFDAGYSVSNFGRSFIAGELAYADRPSAETTRISFARALVSPLLDYAGGLDLIRTRNTVKDSLATVDDNTSELVDLWIGRPIPLKMTDDGSDFRRFLFFSARSRSLRFTKRPDVTESSLFQYHHARHLLGSVAFIQSRYDRANLLYNFGRTQDIPCGFLARVTFGLADEEFRRRPYLSATLAAAETHTKVGYGVGEMRIGGYPEDGGFNHGVLRLRTLCFSELQRRGEFRFRHFLHAQYITGIERFADDSIDLSGDDAIRGVTYDHTVVGLERFLVNLESVTFTPWRPGGVSIALFTFADIDIIGSRGNSLFDQDYYSGLGAGLRLHNAKYGIGPLQLRFAWYPNLPVEHDPYSTTAFGERRFRPIDFLATSPEIVEF